MWSAPSLAALWVGATLRLGITRSVPAAVSEAEHQTLENDQLIDMDQGVVFSQVFYLLVFEWICAYVRSTLAQIGIWFEHHGL